MIYTICYLSSANYTLNIQDLENIFKITLKNNIQNSISGILIYAEGNFLQVLEGEELALKALFQKIKSDKRHHNLITLLSKKNKDRIFESYQSGFSIVAKKADMKSLKNYLKFLNDNMLDANHLISLLKPFFN